jgi:RNA polymerase sigma-70 factor (ECF subfamily)
LCEAYWYPIYEYIRNQGYGTDDAQDLTQAFFARVIEKNYAGQADRERGRFRSFLLGSLKHFLTTEDRRARARKRGGGETALPVEVITGEIDSRVALCAIPSMSPGLD